MWDSGPLSMTVLLSDQMGVGEMVLGGRWVKEGFTKEGDFSAEEKNREETLIGSRIPKSLGQICGLVDETRQAPGKAMAGAHTWSFLIFQPQYRPYWDSGWGQGQRSGPAYKHSCLTPAGEVLARVGADPRTSSWNPR